jgi:uncharacterized protein YndB with AHSA1/START domain
MADLGPVPEGGVRISHIYEARPEEVFAAWVDPDQLARWWAPEGLEVPRDSVVVEPRVGGRFELDMVEPGGPSHPMRGEFVELVESELIVIRSDPNPGAGKAKGTTIRVTFEPAAPGTRMTVTVGPYTDEDRPGAESGWWEMAGKLERLLAG